MNREQAKKLLPIIQAFAEGKTILVQEDIDWRYLSDDADFNLNPLKYRIKPEPKYRPFTNADECWQEMQKHQPFGWIKDKQDGSYVLITNVNDDEDSGGMSINSNGGWNFGDLWIITHSPTAHRLALRRYNHDIQSKRRKQGLRVHQEHL